MDFYTIAVEEKKDGTFLVRPDWRVGRSSDLMTRGGAFYAVWDEGQQTWSTDIYDVVRLVDADLKRFAKENEERTGLIYNVAYMRSHKTGVWDDFQRYLRNSGKNWHALDETLIFADTEVRKQDYSSHRLPYAMTPGDHIAWDTIVGTLYDESERAKIEWAIGAVISGESKKIQKFLVFYGAPGTGKSTVLNIIAMLFEGYTAVFDAQELVGSNNAFATSSFKANPLVGIQHDGNLSRISDNTKLNSIVSHEIMIVNEKYQRPVEQRSNAFLFMGTNLPVKITDAKSGIIRRLIDVVPTGKKLEHDLYFDLMDRVAFELGAIAAHCLERYRSMGKNYYGNYRPTEMMLQTDVFYNFVDAYYLDVFSVQEGITLKQAWELYKTYCEEAHVDKPLPQFKFREELRNYFGKFEDRARVDGVQVRSYYSQFKGIEQTPPIAEIPSKPEGLYRIELAKQTSVFDEVYSAQPAQYWDEAEGRLEHKWSNVTTTLADVDTSKLHYVKVPENHIVIDFDLRDEAGNKDLQASIDAASKWPPTYTEVSQSGGGIHLHYVYNGDVTTLASEFAPHIEIKTLLGGGALRRRLTECNNMNIAPMAGGLPKKEKPVIDKATIMTEKGMRTLIERNLRKEIHPGTKPSVDFIHHILEDAYNSGEPYDLTDMRAKITAFAARSSNQATRCLEIVGDMKFKSEDHVPEPVEVEAPDKGEIVFFDVEVYPNLFVVCWKSLGSTEVVRMINPTPQDVEMLFDFKLVGFNNRRYDNHILYARFLGYSNEALYELSQRIINGADGRQVLFGEAYDVSYADIYDFSSKKQGLKKFQIELGIHHSELDIPWDEPVPEKKWCLVEEYCVNDVISTEAVFNARRQDFVARQILAKLSGLTVNHTTQAHTAKIIFGNDKSASSKFVYTNLAETFPGYVYGPVRNDKTGQDVWCSTYRGEVTGEGGYVYAEPGAYENVAVLDVASMHPTSIIELNAFGPYTDNFKDLLDARLAIKAKDFKRAGEMLDGKLLPFLLAPNEVRAESGEEMYDYSTADELAYALKIVINIVYGLTSAKFNNAFTDRRNVDNFVAKRGALFMIDLKHAVQEQGFQVVHIKTDSIKIPNATPEIIQFVSDFGRKYGYTFEHEATYDRFCLVNDAVYVAREGDKWTAVGAQFQHPYVFKTLFSGEELFFDDFCETKNVTKGAMYLDFLFSNEEETTVDRRHVGRTGSFVPVTDEGLGGATLLRVMDGNDYAVAGTKGYLWIPREMAEKRQADDVLHIDMRYFQALADKARAAIEVYTQDFEAFITEP